MKKNNYVFYEYLHFFWRKKVIFFLIPLVVALGTVMFTLTKDDVYKGEITVYTSSIGINDLTHPDLIQSKFSGKVSEIGVDNFNVSATTGRVLFSFKDPDKDQIKEAIDIIEKNYLKDLNEEYSNRKRHLESAIESYEKADKMLQIRTDFLERKVQQGTLTSDELQESNYLSGKSDFQFIEDMKMTKMELDELDDPKVLSSSITKSNNFIISNLITSVLIGFIFSTLILMLWKYILDARKENDL
ncbi:hypothetical protein NQ095_19265 [Rossellomorea sp. SC111]|uniref:hypothetical protein n=1 Tax=Rossellomorea sp. SC111 TaxID=2968985 RepID=UPI00215A6B5E|nr:hypothetical protein [Rossellomorea sp. SC111]MCR8850564.1 hypothetical protein [Rossellomorea sp. SC111]